MVGLRWKKTDFHVHTMASECYKDKDNTCEEWINRVEEVGLDCVAVTDHNSYENIDRLLELGNQKGIVVFPGVEVTCDTSKIHVLCIFDREKDENYVRDFLSCLGIWGSEIGKSKGCPRTQIFEVCKKAKEFGGVVIAAHIDEFNGLSELSPASQDDILNSERYREYIDAVQVVHSKLWERFFVDKDTVEVEEYLQNYYGKTIEKSVWDRWKKTYKKAKDAQIPMIAGSDNPCGPGMSQHGLWGIGSRYTWIKVEDQPTLEGIRQALISSDSRLVLDEISKEVPERDPEYWLQSVEINKSLINPNKPIKIMFNPQLNTIIGGRGSGKSTIVRLITGAMEALDADEIRDIKAEQDNFYKKTNKKSEGIFDKDSQVTITFSRAGCDYRLTACNISGMGEQDRIIEKWNGDDWEIIDDNYLDLWKAQIFTQKQIFEIAKSPNALLRIIDSDINNIDSYKNDIEGKYRELLEIIREMRSCQKHIDTESRVSAEKKDIEERVDFYKKSGIATIIEEKQIYESELAYVQDAAVRGNNAFELIKRTIDTLPKFQIDESRVKNEEILHLLTSYEQQVNTLLAKIINLCDTGEKLAVQLKKDAETTDWKRNGLSINESFKKKIEELQAKGVDPDQLSNLLNEKNAKQQELDEIEREKERKKALRDRQKVASEEYKVSLASLRKARTEFIESVIGDTSDLQIKIVPYGNDFHFTSHVTELLGNRRSNSVDEDIQTIVNYINFDGTKIEKGINQFREDMVSIRNGNKPSLQLTGYFIRAVKEMSDENFDDLITFWPEDRLKVFYQVTINGKVKLIPLSAASAGQKTTAILTFALAYGTEPLILDQPEDDMDNKLVYGLIVQRLKATKKKRQVIVVTHNANIPVNADAEYIIAMDSEKRFVEVKETGTIDTASIRKEICDVMEGTTFAFKKRAEKYHLHIIE